MFHVVLFEPEIPPNTGNVIRLCANTAATLHLVRPLGFRLDAPSLRRSGLDYHELAEVVVHGGLDECLASLADCRRFAVETGAGRCYSDPAYRGLPAGVLDRLGTEGRVFIPMRPGNRSLNLANAVTVVVYEAWRQLNFAGRDRPAV